MAARWLYVALVCGGLRHQADYGDTPTSILIGIDLECAVRCTGW